MGLFSGIRLPSVAAGYMEAEVEEKNKKNEAIREALKTGIQTTAAYNLNVQSEQNKKLNEVKNNISSLEGYVPSISNIKEFYQITDDTKAKNIQNAMKISIAKSGSSGVADHINNYNTYLANDQIKYGYWQNTGKLDKTKAYGEKNINSAKKEFFRNAFDIPNLENIYANVDSWTIKNALANSTSSATFSPNSIEKSYGNKFKLSKNALDYVKMLGLTHTDGTSLEKLAAGLDPNKTFKGVTWNNIPVTSIKELSEATKLMLENDWAIKTQPFKLSKIKSETNIAMIENNIAQWTWSDKIAMSDLKLKYQRMTNDEKEIDLAIKKDPNYIAIKIKETLLNAKKLLNEVEGKDFETAWNFKLRKLNDNKKLIKSIYDNYGEGEELSSTDFNKVVNLREKNFYLNKDINTLKQAISDEAQLKHVSSTTAKDWSFSSTNYKDTRRDLNVFFAEITGAGDLIDNDGDIIWNKAQANERIALQLLVTAGMDQVMNNYEALESYDASSWSNVMMDFLNTVKATQGKPNNWILENGVLQDGSTPLDFTDTTSGDRFEVMKTSYPDQWSQVLFHFKNDPGNAVSFATPPKNPPPSWHDYLKDQLKKENFTTSIWTAQEPTYQQWRTNLYETLDSLTNNPIKSVSDQKEFLKKYLMDNLGLTEKVINDYNLL